MAFAKTAPDEASFKPLVLGILFGAANKKGVFSQEGAAPLSSSRKESRK